MATDAFKKRYKNVPGLKYNKKGFTVKPEQYGGIGGVNDWSNYLLDAEKYYNKKGENWAPGKYLKLLQLKRKLKKSTKH